MMSYNAQQTGAQVLPFYPEHVQCDLSPCSDTTPAPWSIQDVLSLGISTECALWTWPRSGLHPRAQDLSLHSVWDAMRSLQTPIVPGLYARGITWKPFGHIRSRGPCVLYPFVVLSVLHKLQHKQVPGGPCKLARSPRHLQASLPLCGHSEGHAAGLQGALTAP